MRQDVIDIVQEFSLDERLPLTERALDLGDPLPPRPGNLARVVVGMRRTGKTYRLFQEMARLRAMGVPESRMLYFSFEDDRIAPATTRVGDEALAAFDALNPGALEDGCYLFLDELQEMDGWGRWLRRVIDTRKVSAYVTGSSSKMLSSEIATEMRGRSTEHVMRPLSFTEALPGIDPCLPTTARPLSSREKGRMEAALTAYLTRGGFPAVQGLTDSDAVSVLQGYVQRVVSRDVVERHGLSNPRAVSAFARRLMRLCGRPLSLRTAEADLKGSGTPVTRQALSSVLEYLEEAFLVSSVRDRRRPDAPQSVLKEYPADPGLACANSPASAIDSGQLLECAVAGELLRRTPAMRDATVSSYRTRSGHEVDFCAGDAVFSDDLDLVQATWSMEGPRTRERELRALWEAMEELGRDEATVVTAEGDESEERRDGRAVRIVPAWKWMLGW